MSNQLQITGGAKVRSLEGVITGTSGVLGSVPLGAANGVATLDSGGKVPVSQLPSSVVTYLGTWNAATNTPTLVNGVGDAGDMYICNVAGTVNFGAGPVTFAVGDWVLYGSGTWQKSNGQNGTVTSVGASITGNAIGLTGSPITTAGTLAFAFSGTSGQYVNGAGNLTTFPTLITSIGLSMPSAFSVANSPLTANGSINVTGAGTTAQYIDGTGALQTFPSIISQASNLVTEVWNESGATLSKGTVVYINGGHGNLPTITKALATSDATSAQTYGVVQADITNNNNGYVVVIGTLGDLDTQSYAAGTQLYLSSTTAGAWTSTKQYAPAHLVYVGIVVRSHPTQGVVEVKIQNGYEMDELHNVSAQSPVNGAILQYVTSTGLWTAVAGTTTNIAEGTNLYYTDARSRAAISLTTTGTSGAATYNSTTGVLNVPNYAPDLSGYVTLATNQTISGVKTFSANPSINTGGQSSLSILSSTGNSALILAYVNSVLKGTIDISGTEFKFVSGINSTFKFQASGLGIASLIFDNTTNYSYTFPSATGTIALVGGSGVGTVTSVDLSAPTGFSVSGSPVVSSGTLALAFAAGYSLPTTASQTNWDTAYTNRITSATSPLSITSNVISISQATTSTSGYLSSTDWNTFNNKGSGTVTSVAALTLGTTGTDLSSSVANGTTTPVITLNVPDASATARGVITTGTQTIAGVKTFSSYVNLLSSGVDGTYADILVGLYSANLTEKNTISTSVSSTASNSGFKFNVSNGGGAATTTTVLTLTRGGATFSTSVTASSLIKSGGTSSQFLKADGSVDSTSYQGALTLTTTGTSGAATLVGNTLNIPQYSGGGGSMAIGGSITSATAGSVLFVGASTDLQQDNTNLFWDNTNKRLGIGTNAPSNKLDIVSSTNGSVFSITGLGGTNPNFVMQGNGEQTFRFYNNAATGSARVSWKLANRNNTDWQWIMYNDYTATGANDFTLSNATNGSCLFINTSGYIGLGTTTVGSKLQVNGNVAIGYSASTAAPTNGLAVNGIVGFGTTAPKSYTSFTNNGQFLNLNNIIINAAQAYRFNAYYNSVTVTDKAVSTGYAADFYLNNATGSILWRSTAASFTADADITLVNRLEITSSGNVGIGTTTIGSKLQVNGNAAIGYSASTAAPTNGLKVAGVIQSADTYGWAIGQLAGAARIQHASDVFTLLTTTNGYGSLSANVGTFQSSVTATNYITGGVANTASFAATGYSLTGANAQSLLDLAGTWNTTGNPTAIKLNITNTASGATSNLMDLQVGGVSKMSVDKSGNLTANNVVSGTYTPTINTTTNIASSSVGTWQYMRVGNTVTVSGSITITPTLGVSTTSFNFSLPINSTFATGNDCAGTGVDYNATTYLMINGNSGAANYGLGLYRSTTTSAMTLSIQFTYIIK